MKTNRRNFLRNSVIGAGMLSSDFFSRTSAKEKIIAINSNSKNRRQTFNMCGFRTLKIDTARVGFIGLGNCAPIHVNGFFHFEGVKNGCIDFVTRRGYFQLQPWTTLVN